jgi:calcineurin-like phosphoesterase
VPTADVRVLPQGTGYVTDLGMVGPRDGVIGMDRDRIITKFLNGLPSRFVVAEGPVQFNAVLFEVEEATRRCLRAERVDRDL